LAQRDGLDARHGYLLWLGHVVASLSGTNGCNRVLVDFDRMMQSPEFEVNRIAKSLDLKINQTELQIYQSEFLDENLRHTAFGLGDLILDEACPQLVLEIYKVLLDVASDKINIAAPELQNKIFCWEEEFERLKAPLTLVDRLFSEKASNVKSLAERDVELAKLNQKLVELYSSTSWRVTKPIRSIRRVINSVRGVDD
jgi:hypothetical protein